MVCKLIYSIKCANNYKPSFTNLLHTLYLYIKFYQQNAYKRCAQFVHKILLTKSLHKIQTISSFKLHSNFYYYSS